MGTLASSSIVTGMDCTSREDQNHFCRPNLTEFGSVAHFLHDSRSARPHRSPRPRVTLSCSGVDFDHQQGGFAGLNYIRTIGGDEWRSTRSWIPRGKQFRLTRSTSDSTCTASAPKATCVDRLHGSDG